MNKKCIILNCGNNIKYHNYVTFMLRQLNELTNHDVFILCTRDIINESITNMWFYEASSVNVLYVDNYLDILNMNNLLNDNYFSRTALLKCLIPFINELKKYDKLLYIDSDIYIKKDFNEIFDIDLCDNQIAMCIDPNIKNNFNNHFIKSINNKIRHLKYRFQDIHKSYYNTGVILFKNTNNINEDVYNNLKKYIEIHYKKHFELADQDIINLSYLNVYELDQKYNTHVKDDSNNVVFLHYMGQPQKDLYNKLIFEKTGITII